MKEDRMKEDRMKFQIFVDGEINEPEKIRVSAYPLNRVWPGKQRDITQSMESYMLRLTGEGRKTIRIVTEYEAQRVVIRPLSKGIAAKVNGNCIEFDLSEHGKFSIEMDGRNQVLHLFYQKERVREEKQKITYLFGPGEHNAGLLQLRSGDTVFIDKNAVVHGSLYAVDAEDITICGNGVVCGDWEKRTKKHGDLGFDGENFFSPELVHTYGGIRMYRCNNIRVEGITVTDTASYAVSFFRCSNVQIEDINVAGLWKYNTDGIDFFNTSNVFVRDCFIRSFDDCMCMKGLTAFSDQNVENVRVSRCVFWCDWGKNLDLGLATAAPEMKDIVWEDCDIIHSSGTCIAISNGQWADIHDVLYRNIRIEYALDTPIPQYQNEDDERYQDLGKTQVPQLIVITDSRRTWQGNISYDDPRTKIRRIHFENIQVILENGMVQQPEIIIQKNTKSSFIDKIDTSQIQYVPEKNIG